VPYPWWHLKTVRHEKLSRFFWLWWNGRVDQMLLIDDIIWNQPGNAFLAKDDSPPLGRWARSRFDGLDFVEIRRRCQRRNQVREVIVRDRLRRRYHRRLRYAAGTNVIKFFVVIWNRLECLSVTYISSQVQYVKRHIVNFYQCQKTLLHDPMLIRTFSNLPSK